MARDVIDPRLTAGFDAGEGGPMQDRLTIQATAGARTALGSYAGASAAVEGMENIPAHIGRAGRVATGAERRSGVGTPTLAETRALLDGYFPEITTEHVAVDGEGFVYNITRVDHSQRAMTALGLEVVS